MGDDFFINLAYNVNHENSPFRVVFVFANSIITRRSILYFYPTNNNITLSHRFFTLCLLHCSPLLHTITVTKSSLRSAFHDPKDPDSIHGPSVYWPISFVDVFWTRPCVLGRWVYKRAARYLTCGGDPLHPMVGRLLYSSKKAKA